MKRKVYVKQMKILKEKTKSQEKTKGAKESETDSNNFTLSDTVVVVDPSQHNSETAHHSLRSVTSMPAAPTPTPTVDEDPVTNWLRVTASALSNSGPLPTVDVLMKRSTHSHTHKYYQPRHHIDSNVEEDRNENNVEKVSLHQPQTFESNAHIASSSSLSSSSSSYMNNHEYLGNIQRVEGWSKDCSPVESPNPGLMPKLIRSSYGIECPPRAYNVNLDQPGDQINENLTRNDSPSPPPVFHQLQVSGINNKPIEADIPSAVSGYPSEQENNSIGERHQVNQSQFNLMDTGCDVIHHHPHHQPHHHDHNNQIDPDTCGYHHNSAPQLTNNKIHDDHFHEYHGHGQVRAWEQENYRYVDFTWRHAGEQDEPESMSYDDLKSTDEEDQNIKQRINANVLDESVDLSNKTTTPRPTSKSGGGRRRRKRVQTPVQRSAANMRERKRMCHLNVAFEYLKEHLPNVKDKKKMSRIQTLKAAIYYIHLLQDSLNVH